MNKHSKIGLGTIIISVILFAAGYMYFNSADDFAVLNIPMFLIPLCVILFTIGLSFFLLGRGISRASNYEDKKTIK